MAYIDYEISPHSGQPVELYRFEGMYDNYLMTSDAVAHTLAAEVYEPKTIKRSNLKIGTQDDTDNAITVTMPSDEQLAQDFAFQSTPPFLVLTIYRYHRGDAEAIVYWTGPITGIVINDNEAELTASSILARVLTSDLPSVYYQGPCNHVLYDERCGVSRAANTISSTILITHGRYLILLDDGGKPDAFFTAGEVLLASGERRMILAHSGNNLTINYPFTKTEVNVSCQVAAGCNHLWGGGTENGDCVDKFSNGPNYGGFPLIPTVNPFVDGVDEYGKSTPTLSGIWGMLKGLAG